MSVTIHGLKLAINVSEATEELREEIHQADRALVVLNTWADRLDTARYGDNGARLALLEGYAQQERNFGESLAKWAVEDAKYPVKSVATDNTEEPTKPDGYSDECDCAACEAYRAERDRSTA